jgi:hypothetical protein
MTTGHWRATARPGNPVGCQNCAVRLTSPDYGRSEELIGTCIGHRRQEFFLASKCGCPLVVPFGALPPYPHDYSPGNVRADVEQSLRARRAAPRS